MKHRHTRILMVVTAATMAVLPARATIIQMELYNSFALVDSDNSTLLAGDASAGDLVQVIAIGSDNLINAPSASNGLPTGDDTILFTLHVGTGIPSPGTGLLDAYPLNYSSTLVGSNFYVRFWNGATVAGSTYYGNSLVTNLPAGDAFNQSQMDFVPTEGSPHITDQPFTLNVVPEPSSLFLFGLVVFGAWTWRRRQWIATSAVPVAMVTVAQNVPAQRALPLDVTARTRVADAHGAVLSGNNPACADF